MYIHWHKIGTLAIVMGCSVA